MGKRKIFNDPVHGFVSIPNNSLFELIEHPYFQRLRRIQQLGLTSYVYPGALHTRFPHAIGACHLMHLAIDVLRDKGHSISPEEEEAAMIAILLHDIGHGPFSHTLENSLIHGVSHEQISLILMDKLNEEFKGKLGLALKIFKGEYEKPFLNELVSSQLDVDRLDYLSRDSYFTGVYEGVIGYDRILKMLEVRDGRICVEAKGIYSIEKFLIARRLMYWQVYLHKTVLVAEHMLLQILKRSIYLVREKGLKLPASRALSYFLENKIELDRFAGNEETIRRFTQLDDYDIFVAIKDWIRFEDPVLSILCQKLVERRLLRIELHDEPIDTVLIDDLIKETAVHYKLDESDAQHLVLTGSTSNHVYDKASHKNIKILYKDESLVDIAEASDQLNISVLAQPVVKYYLCYSKELKRPSLLANKWNSQPVK